MAFKDGCAKANPVILEPIMGVEVETPEDYMGDVMGDLNRRRGLILGMDDNFGAKVIRAEVPLSEMRSEEHTSELQSLMRISYADYCLKKKNIAHSKTENDGNTALTL